MIAALVIVIGIVVVPALAPSFGSYTFFAGIAASVAAVLWWLFFSRAPWLERLGVVAAMAVAVYVVSFFVHRSIENGMMGLMLYIFSVPALAIVLVAGGVLIGESYLA